ncbi:rRNA (cytosine-C(5))-methyltransferase NOP2C isoform X1 [Cryptomeria japonica]|uniref:rRNA (cytosine-C(5))-methyltransferase NOP2C isoform X1 n=1 Tax=Cryptomeria japonica TaxID=3369 RepID=UPI0027DAB397|nr:rRNA (cytosine-C(5))-methyltransferase NOP2C isoform X1 [Cryptomeria japonica]XP_057854318.2 rRNA (cytosine-C(5))-methyltransferase NOP2C isoform X1 [Cryptomeria japonica]
MEVKEKERYNYDPKLQWDPQVTDYFNKIYGQSHFDRISHSLMRPSLYSCIRMNVLKTKCEEILHKLSSLLHETGFSEDDEMKSLHRKVTADSGKSNDSRMMQKPHGIFQCLNAKENMQLNLEASGSATISSLSGVSVLECPHDKVDDEDLLCCKLPGMEYVVIVHGSGPFKIKYDVECSKPIKEVIVSRKCAEAVLRGADVFVPGVLACSAHVEKGDTVAVSVAVECHDPVVGWAVNITRGTILSGEEGDAYYSERSGFYIGKGTALMSRTGIFRETKGIAIKMVDKIYRHPPFHGVLKGEIFLQNLPSIIAAHVLDAKPGEKILDMCAAPGGKTTAIAMLMEDKGELIAIDRSHNKVVNIQNLAEEMGLTCVHAYKLDALKSVKTVDSSDAVSSLSSSLACKQTEDTILEEQSTCTTGAEDDNLSNHLQVVSKNLEDRTNGFKNSSLERYISKAKERKAARKMKNGPGRGQELGGRAQQSRGFEINSFDRILLDAPCSALGLRPRLFAGEETLETLRMHSIYQKRMFDQAVQLVRPGGIIVYSTCTINPGENEALVRYALDKYKFLALEPQYPKIGGPGLVGGLDVFNGRSYKEWLREGEQDLVQRFDPSNSLDTIGFFIAKFKVKEKNSN